MTPTKSPSDARYSDSHEWHRHAGGVVTLGITPFAVNELTDITYVQIKPVGSELKAGDSIGEVESVKATSDIYTAVPGTILEVNTELADHPELVNADPFGKGWLVKIKVSDPAPLNALMDAAAYDAKYKA